MSVWGPFTAGQGPLSSVGRACAPHAEGHGFESRRWLSLSGSFRVPAFLGIPCPHGSCQFAFYGQPGSRDELLALRAALCLRTFTQCGKGDKAGGKQADSLAWMRKRCSLPAGLPDSFGMALQVWYCCSIATC